MERERKVYHITLLGSLVNFILLVFKFVAGFIGRSSAMIADAVHSLSDFVTDLVVLVFVKISKVIIFYVFYFVLKSKVFRGKCKQECLCASSIGKGVKYI